MRAARHDLLTAVTLAALLPSVAAAQNPPPQTEADGYTRYELLAPPAGTGKFRILYEVTATTAGATAYFNPIRKGSIATDERVTDRATGKPLKFDVVGNAIATAGGVRGGDSSQTYIRVMLAHSVPANDGEARLLIDKTYQDPKSYFFAGDTLVFNRPLGIKRNTVVLPPGYELISCNYPSQVLQQPDGRIAISFWNATPAEAPLIVKARATSMPPAVKLSPPLAGKLDERAHQNRKIVYFLRAPETHAFDLYHDYTESKPGESTYVNVVRPGSTVANPSARDLDTGASLTFEVLKGDALSPAKLGVPAEELAGAMEAVVFRYPPVKPGESIRIRMYETYTDSVRYGLQGEELIWNRSFGRAADAVVLPAGWLLTNSSIPATVSEMPDGRIRLDFINPRNDEIAVLITAHRRKP